VPSVVTIQVTGSSSAASGTGSGEFFRSGGYILTNNHVIATAANGGRIEVVLSDGQRAVASLVGRDALTDLAVLRVSEPTSPRVIGLGSSSNIDVGQPVVAVGAPLGLSSTLTSGIVSALGRTVEVPGESASSSALLVDALQTDAAINPGNSGGALVDCDGRLIGVPTAGAQVPGSTGGSIGLGFAIPVDLADAVASEIIATGRVTHASFGLRAVPVGGATGTRSGGSTGLYVTVVQTGGPAAAAGLRPGDIITEIEGQPAHSVDQLMVLTITKRPGDKVEITYERNGLSTTTTITLGSQS
jgi:putative serine protease PepD